MPHTHTDDLRLHSQRGDEADKTLTAAMVAFTVVGGIGFVVAILAGRIALAVDSIHNLCEAPILGINRAARRMSDQVRSHLWTCWVLPLAPAFSAGAAIVVAAMFLAVSQHNPALRWVWIAFVIEVLSAITNGWFARKLHAHHHHGHGDSNVVTAKLHLVGDMGASGVAAAAYFVIGTSQGNAWLDPAAAFVGIGLIVLFHIAPIKNSLQEFRRHRQPGHARCVNSPPSQR